MTELTFSISEPEANEIMRKLENINVMYRVVEKNLQVRIDQERIGHHKTDEYNVYLDPESYQQWIGNIYWIQTD